MINILALILGGFMGYFYYILSSKKRLKNNIKKDNLNKTKQFREILDNISIGKSKFKTRIKDSVYIETKLKDYGEITLIYFMDLKKLSIFKNDECIIGSDGIDSYLIDRIITSIRIVYGEDISNMVELYGIKMHAKDFESSFGICFGEYQDILNKIKNNPIDINDFRSIKDKYTEKDHGDFKNLLDSFIGKAFNIEPIGIKIEKNNNDIKNYDFEELLDKISKLGIDSLSKDENEFMVEYSKALSIKKNIK